MANTMLQRSVSMPIRPKTTTASTSDTSIEILFNIPSEVRIISFTATATTQQSKQPSSSYAISGEDERLSWTSRFERTIAIGPLRIYRAPGSVAFLKCASALRPILPKSKCWVLNEEGTTFILQVNPPQYWRIEVLPADGLEVQYGEMLRDVLARILMIDKTPCPFHRNFVIELPSPPQTPVRKRPWKPVERSSSVYSTGFGRSDIVDTNPGRMTPSPSVEDAKTTDITSPDVMVATKEIARDIDVSTPSTPFFDGDRVLVAKKRQGIDCDASVADSNNDDRTSMDPQDSVSSADLEPSEPPMLKQCNRAVTAPPLLSLLISPPSKRPQGDPRRSPCRSPKARSRRSGASDGATHRQTSMTSSSYVSSTESFYSTKSWHSPITPGPPLDEQSPSRTAPGSFPYPHDKITLPPPNECSRQTSEMTLTQGMLDPPQTPPLLPDSDAYTDSDHDEIATPPSPRLRLRHLHRTARSTSSRGASRRQDLSPLPAASNLFLPSESGTAKYNSALSSLSITSNADRKVKKKQHRPRLPIIIMQKTCEILLSPPSHLLHLMLSIAAKIAAGEWKGVLFGKSNGEAVHWDLERDEFIDEDDYGISLGGLEPERKGRASKSTVQEREERAERMSGTWEVD